MGNKEHCLRTRARAHPLQQQNVPWPLAASVARTLKDRGALFSFQPVRHGIHALEAWYILQSVCHPQPGVFKNHSFHLIRSSVALKINITPIVTLMSSVILGVMETGSLQALWDLDIHVVSEYSFVSASFLRLNSGTSSPFYQDHTASTCMVIQPAPWEKKKEKIYNQPWFNRTDMPFFSTFFKTPFLRYRPH